MEKVKIEDLDIENTYFHFTRSKWLQDIEKNGVTANPPERENMVIKDKEKPCIYFSKGNEGVLKTIDVWIRWEYNNLAYKMGFPSGHKEINNEILQKTFEKVYQDFKNRNYLQLDLIEGDDTVTSDFSSLSTDYKKEFAINGGDVPEIFKWLYGEYSNFNSAIMEDWNMNTHIGDKIIEPNRIRMITDSKGKSDVLSVIQEMYQKYKNPELKLEELDKFMEYAKEKNKENENEQYYYHHTKVKNLKSIVETGLEPRNEEQSQVVKDEKKVVFFSEGMQGAIAMAASFQHKFDSLKKGTEYEDKSLEDFLGKGVFLRFSPKGIENESNNKEYEFADGWTTQKIEPQKLKVCFLRSQETGDILYDRDDIIKYMMATNSIDDFTKGNEGYRDYIKKYYEMRGEEISSINLEDYILEDMDLDKFYEQYISQDKDILFTEEEVGKNTITKQDTERADIAQARYQRDERQMEVEQEIKEEK